MDPIAHTTRMATARRRLNVPRVAALLALASIGAGATYLEHTRKPPPSERPEIADPAAAEPVAPAVSAPRTVASDGSPQVQNPSSSPWPVGECGMALRLTNFLAGEHAGQNFVWSPHSLTIGLSLTALGTWGETLQELLEFVEFRGTNVELAQALNQADAVHSSTLREASGSSYLRNAAIWTDGALVADFKQAAKLLHRTELHKADFFTPGGRASAIATINRWAARNTRGRVKELLPPNWIPEPYGAVRGRTGSILVNTLFFANRWMERPDTRAGLFHPSEGSEVPAEFLVFDGHYRYLDDSVATSVALRLLGSPVQAIFLLPKDPSVPLDAALAPVLHGYRSVRPRHAQVELPKFHIASGFNLKEKLKRLGVARVFEPGRAELKITAADVNWIHEIRQSVDIKIDERGIVAAAGTAVQERVESMPDKVVFDRPFFFFLLGPSGELLFAGRIANPSSEGPR